MPSGCTVVNLIDLAPMLAGPDCVSVARVVGGVPVAQSRVVWTAGLAGEERVVLVDPSDIVSWL